ncbi:hypothetical protein COU62_04365 [Candidatus Pacearchaeota archaeon CG10_big_fil_rev_8_21_14_0_10_35_219]|nr:MAG: hypothetical protein AUJ63_04105 [Candidatus Pacearchaeota archaeon CG1_02_35_32]PIO07227.1 MAG: hypothetical protein COU62_04365 [Candidatus Pacearchaeota archaeon CG10_big_fil_rev_8_21_14_0_10_35_219]PIZ79455.1 MAG: hypothetical protein COY00_04155 [Candidatus Pacearchaeota archaeon CG_4_10_14_0_2_um_filter_35_33]PJB94556.1 MAG: hypothetical protein CO081_00210 [Candidatus Pacearchaeota archaeon CG_4_9_14_0_8_um_filter_35_24]
MALTEEQIKELKRQLLEQIQHLPEEQKAQAEQQINDMSPEALETMLKQQWQQTPQKVFRAIIEGKIPARKLDENKQALAVLEIMPIEKGHVIIIPKKPVQNQKDMPAPALTLAKKIAKKIQSKLKAKSVEILMEPKFEEIIINIVPVYNKSVSLESQRRKAEETELLELQNRLKKKTRPLLIKKTTKKKKDQDIKKIKRRIA